MSKEVWVGSDHHFHHKNIIKFQPNREDRWETVDDMNEYLIYDWNRTVKPEDVVWYLGDLSFGSMTKIGEVLDQLNGNIHFIRGNHDGAFKNNFLRNKVKWYGYYHELRGFHKLPIILSHFPFHSWNRQHYGALHLHGHSHANGQNIGRRFDVGIDGNDCRLYNLPYLVDKLKDLEVVTFDHHNSERK